MTTAKFTPPLKWAGGKTWLAPKLAGIYEPYRDTHTWVEMFCGGLGATLGVMPKRAILSDSNPHLINLYQQIDSGMSNNICSNTANEDNLWANNQHNFNRIRESFNKSPFTNRFNAQAFYYLNRVGYRGLCRTNASGGFNTPYGHYKKPKLDHDFSVYREAFAYWDFLKCDYETALFLSKEHIRPTFIYADPPYDAGFTGYSGAFKWDDQVNLAEMLGALDSPVVASNKATDRIIDLYKSLGFAIEYIEAPRRIACNGDRKPVAEMIATKNI